MKRIAILILILSLIFVSGINGCKENKNEIEEMKEKCISVCKELSKQKILVSECILDPIPNTKWVCDIAHSPREAVDNLRENQCNAWHSGEAKHFIEITPECSFIKAI